MGRALRYFLVIGIPCIAILLFLLVLVSNNTLYFTSSVIEWAIGLNVLAAISMLISVAYKLRVLYKDYRQGKFGTRLMAKLALLFGLIGILPGIVIYAASVTLVWRSLDTMFDANIERALKAGAQLSQDRLKTTLNNLEAHARSLALDLADLPDTEIAHRLAKQRNTDFDVDSVVFTSNSRVIASSGSELNSLMPDLPNSTILREADSREVYKTIKDGMDDSEGAERSSASNSTDPKAAGTPITLLVVVPILGSGMDLSLQPKRYLKLTQVVPAGFNELAHSISDTTRAYGESKLARKGLLEIYLSTLTLTLLLAIFGAVAAGFLIATNLARPLLLLAEGTKAVAEGDLSPRPIVVTNDELGVLTQSFNVMTRQLHDAQVLVEQNQAELESAKAYLESVLANMSAGVMVLDHHFVLVSCNESVERILHIPLERRIGQSLASIPGLQTFSAAVTKAFSEQNAQTAADHDTIMHQHWQQQIEVARNLEPGASLTDSENTATLLARGSRLPVRGESGYVVVFDDISDVISGQRSLAWGEVARRLAHEIKNPLTPIQLSAERLQMKLSSKLSGPDAAMLERSTGTIVSQVDAMKRMVDDFRNYAKTPPAVLEALDLNELIEEILHLYLGVEDHQLIHAQLRPNLPKVLGDPTQLRQVIHNLLQNAQDAAVDHHGSSSLARIDLMTEQISYVDSDGNEQTAVRVSITDNGPGFSPKIMGRAFEPYVTTKPRGTGLGLPMVKKIIDEHGGRIDIQNRQDTTGAKVSILLLKLAPGE